MNSNNNAAMAVMPLDTRMKILHAQQNFPHAFEQFLKDSFTVPTEEVHAYIEDVEIRQELAIRYKRVLNKWNHELNATALGLIMVASIDCLRAVLDSLESDRDQSSAHDYIQLLNDSSVKTLGICTSNIQAIDLCLLY